VAGTLGAALLAASMPLLTAGAARASTKPPWEDDTNGLGHLTFFNAAGDVVTGGSDLGHLFAYAQGDSADANNGLKATLLFAVPTPTPTPVNTANFPVAADSGSVATSQPAAGVPAPINTADPVVNTSAAGAADLQDFITVNPTSPAPGYTNVIQVRIVTAGGGGGSLSIGEWWESDILINPTAGTWVELYPTQGTGATATTTTLSASPPGSAMQHATVTLTAQVDAADSTHPAGTVVFSEDGLQVGSGDVDTGTGAATLTTSTLLPSAPHAANLTAVFTPSNTSSYSPSTSATLDYAINPVAAVPSISGAHQVGAAEHCAANGLTYGVTAAFSWLANGSKIGTGASFVVPGSAYKKSLACVATVQDGSGPTSSATSASVTVLLGKPLKAIHPPTLSGLHKVGKKETVKPGIWSPKATSFNFQWLVNGKPIKGATKSSLVLPRSTKGKKVACKVTAKAAGSANGTATTASVKVS
jgi:hypothetical protein